MSSLNSVNFNRVSGLASGIDYESIINNLMKAERIPLDKLNQNKTILEWKQQDYKSLAKDIYDFNQQVFNMQLSSSYKAKTVGVSNEVIASATASTSAVNGIYTLDVTALAKPAYMASSENLPTSYNSDGSKKTLKEQFSSITASGSVNLSIVNGGKEATITVDLDNDTIYTLASKITNSGIGITASYDENLHRFFIMSNTTGSTNNISYKDIDSSTLMSDILKLPTSASGSDAQFEFNGLAFTQPTNSFTINGLNVNLKAAGTSTITVNNDTDYIFNQVKDILNKYNDVISKINTKLSEERYPDYLPLTDDQREQLTDKQQEQWEEKARSGLLKNDPMLSSLLTSMRNAIYTKIDDADPSYDTLADIGVTTGFWYENGKLYIDDSKLRDAIENNSDAVINLMQGVMGKMNDVIDNGLDSIKQYAGDYLGVTLFDQSFLARQIRDMNDRILEMEDRLSVTEDRYYRQFTQMEQLISQMNAQSAWLAQQFQ
ncbi:MAG: flagellar filament capping protein FliD [Thermoanaerobacteraceae bacterium]|nr:flagellar filament capping protein FliD [Thermoanaerobacteraceae bacterium]